MYKEKYLKYKTKYLELKNQLDGISNTIQEGGGGSWPWPWPTSTQNDPNIRIIKTTTELKIQDIQNNVTLLINRTQGDISITNSRGGIIHINNTDFQNVQTQITDMNKHKPIYKNLFQKAIDNLNDKPGDVEKNCINILDSLIINLNR